MSWNGNGIDTCVNTRVWNKYNIVATASCKNGGRSSRRVHPNNDDKTRRSLCICIEEVEEVSAHPPSLVDVGLDDNDDKNSNNDDLGGFVQGDDDNNDFGPNRVVSLLKLLKR